MSEGSYEPFRVRLGVAEFVEKMMGAASSRAVEQDDGMELSEFLLARIAEDEAVAAEAGADSWEVADERKVRWVRNGGNAHGWAAFADLPTVTEHIARHDPARVLAECAAKRQITRNVRAWTATKAAHPGDVITSIERELNRVLRYLALPYADHPDYRPEWKP